MIEQDTRQQITPCFLSIKGVLPVFPKVAASNQGDENSDCHPKSVDALKSCILGKR
jgi:hypothetical protein